MPKMYQLLQSVYEIEYNLCLEDSNDIKSKSLYSTPKNYDANGEIYFLVEKSSNLVLWIQKIILLEAIKPIPKSGISEIKLLSR